MEIMFKPRKELVAHPGEILQMILIEMELCELF